MRAWAMTSLLTLTVLAGCISDQDQPDDTPVVPASDIRLEAGTVHMDVPVPVFLIGFEAAMASGLEDALDPFTQSTGAALAPTAVYEVHTPSAEWQAEFDAFIETASHPGNAALTGFDGAILDGNAIEEYLVEALPGIHPVPEGITSLVVLDTGMREHAFHYAGDVGWREPVRLFGERYDFLVWDPHAAVDPWVGSAAQHHVPTSAATAAGIAAWVEQATAIRALQMPIWAPTVEPCHAVTIILAVRGTTVTPAALGLQDWDETLDIDRLQATFENLTDDPVYVDLVVLHLPQDDPPLELVTRENNARTITATYLDANFDAYHVPHEGCEPYLSLVVYGDLADQRTSSNGNAQMSINGRRISTSLVAENVRVMTETVGYNDVWDESTNFERVGPGADPYEWFNWVVSHETGHLFSLPHPNYAPGTGGFSDTGFASTWNVMGYQMRRIVTEMSHVDTHNMARNQAAYAVVHAAAEGIDQAVIDDALAAMSEYRWKDATRLLQEAHD